eukprot:Opistho-1_new@59226
MASLRRGFLCLFAIALCVCVGYSSADVAPEMPSPEDSREGTFREALVVRPLRGGRLQLADFRFDIAWEGAGESEGHYTLFPISIGSLFSSHPSLRRLSLSFGRGVWRAEQWGLPLADAAPSGAVLWASFASSQGSCEGCV